MIFSHYEAVEYFQNVNFTKAAGVGMRTGDCTVGVSKWPNLDCLTEFVGPQMKQETFPFHNFNSMFKFVIE